MSHATVTPSEVCPVCLAPGPRFFIEVDGCGYARCEACEATFMLPAHLPGAQVEEAEYRLHRNEDGKGYRRWLERLARPLLERLPGACDGLDFGCGPGPVLAGMLRAAGHRVALYDPFFAPDAGALSAGYDFITCTEVVEHFHHPAVEFGRLDALLRPGGWLGITTCFQTDDARFARWHYRRDPTHVVFYREATFRAIAREYGWSCEIPEKDVVLMQKPAY